MEVKCLRMGITNIYLIKTSGGFVLIDAGGQRKERRFEYLLAREGIRPRDIKLIIITHAHYDHVGSLAGIKRACGSQVLAHPLEAEIMATGEAVIPPGTTLPGKTISMIGRRTRNVLSFEPIQTEIKVSTEYDMGIYGIKGSIVPTPGHTPGSISLLMNNGNAYVGDLAVNWAWTGFLPGFAEAENEIYRSWDMIIQRGVKNVFPAHGSAFKIRGLQEALARRAILVPRTA